MFKSGNDYVKSDRVFFFLRVIPKQSREIFCGFSDRFDTGKLQNTELLKTGSRKA